MSKSRFVFDKFAKLIEQGLLSYKDLSEEIVNILKSKRDEIVFRMKLTSKEEFEIINKLMKQFIGAKFYDNGKERKLEASDILIVSPYNAQVNFLLERLVYKGIRVGTIDKFQGQQAPITIISMTSSDVENLPRNKSFFFSRNRLNVSTSRSMVTSIVLFNPKLLDTAPDDYEEMKMLNNYHKLLKYKCN